MKTTIRRVLFLGSLLLLWAGAAQAAHLPVFAQWGGEKIIKAVELPRSAIFQLRDGTHVDAGYRYKQVSVFFVPLWNYDVAWCGYVGSDDKYVDVSREQLEQLAALANVSLPKSPDLPFWDVFGGKLLLATLVLGYLGFSRKTVLQPALPDESQALPPNLSKGPSL
jgi:hypothetical protein